MSPQDRFERIVESVHKAALDDAHWPSAACLIDEAIRTKGNALVHGEGPNRAEAKFSFVHLCVDGQRRIDWERRYFRDYWAWDECISRLCRLPDLHLVHTGDLYTDREKKTSLVYNEVRCGIEMQNGLNVRLDGPDGSHIVWNIANSLAPGGWRSHQIETIERLLPHMRQFVRVRQALVDAGALGSSLTTLLDNSGCCVIHLNRHARIVAANDRARDLLSQGHGLSDRDGFLRGRTPAEDAELQRLLARALPPFDARGSAGSMTVGRSSARTRRVVHIHPVDERASGYRAQRVAALALVADPESRVRVDPSLVAMALGLTATESRLAAMLAAGHSVSDIAAATFRTEGTVRWHLNRIFRKQGISRQTELVRRVLSLSGLADSRPRSPS